jgi:predicted Zn-dependent protease with MMP-like domain
VISSTVSFEEHVQRALDELPPELARALENVAVVIEDEAADDPDLFGLWEADEFMPDKITVFEKPLTAAFPDPRELEQEIRITVLHELAHYFGIDEDRLDELGYS